MRQYEFVMAQAEGLEAAQDFAGAYHMWSQVINLMPNENDTHLLYALEHLARLAYRCQLIKHGAAVLRASLRSLKSGSVKRTKRYADLLQKLGMLFYLGDDFGPAVEFLLNAMEIYELDFEQQFDAWRTAAQSLALVYERHKERSAADTGTRPDDEAGECFEWQLFCDSDQLLKLCAA